MKLLLCLSAILAVALGAPQQFGRPSNFQQSQNFQSENFKTEQFQSQGFQQQNFQQGRNQNQFGGQSNQYLPPGNSDRFQNQGQGFHQKQEQSINFQGNQYQSNQNQEAYGNKHESHQNQHQSQQSNFQNQNQNSLRNQNFNSQNKAGAFANKQKFEASHSAHSHSSSSSSSQHSFKAQSSSKKHNSGSKHEEANILSDANPDGSYAYSYDTSDGTSVEQSGFVKSQGSRSEDKILSVKGSYSYIAPEGERISVSYVADENGYRATSNKF